MRIAIVAPVEVRVPPLAYGGTELVVSILTEELVRRGHDLTLFASGDSSTRAKLVSVVPEFLWKSNRKRSPRLSLLNMVQALERADEFDIIHNHTNFEGLAAACLVKTPFLTTLHSGLEGDSLALFKYYSGWYNTISKSAKSLLPPKERFAGVIYNAIDCSAYPFNGGSREEYLLFLSRLSPEKGPHIAIQIARKLNKRLIIAGSVNPVDKEYFETEILPYIDGKRIKYEGEVTHQRKKELLAGAKCLLAPITWPEPFGLFMIEAMACGTPVVAMNKGSAGEVICHGKTGYVVNATEKMMDAISKIDRIEPKTCRRHVLEHFDIPVLAKNYLEAYQRVIENEKISLIEPQLAISS